MKSYLKEKFNINIFEMANLSKSTTNLKVIIYVSVGKGGPHSPRIKVNKTYGNKFRPYDTFSITINKLKIIGNIGDIKIKDINQIKKWIKMNEKILLEYWEGNMETINDKIIKFKGDLK